MTDYRRPEQWRNPPSDTGVASRRYLMSDVTVNM
jgi:hypothetical protein